MSHHDDLYPPQSPYHTGMRGLCPRCGQGRLFTGFINVAPKCEVCGLDFAFADAGDGPAVFVTLLAGFVVMGLALWTVVVYEPPMWLFMLIFLPGVPGYSNVPGPEIWLFIGTYMVVGVAGLFYIVMRGEELLR